MAKVSSLVCECVLTTAAVKKDLNGGLTRAGTSEIHSDNEAVFLTCAKWELHKTSGIKGLHVTELMPWCWACLTEDEFNTRLLFLVFLPRFLFPRICCALCVAAH